ncbi:MAG: tol-pal system protein YbgF [Desulfovibrio sp.]|nr:tol-pal system protein YbgF [Desulfovibrio sp.]
MLKQRSCQSGWLLTLLLGGALSLTSCVNQSNVNLEEQIREQDQQIRMMQETQAETLTQLQAMRQENAELKGQLTKHSNALHQVENSMDMHFNLGDPVASKPSAQLKPTEQGALPESQVATPVQPKTNLGTYGEPLVANQPKPAPAEGQVQAGALPSQTQAAQAPPTESTWGKETPRAQPAPTQQKDLALALYDAGLNAYHARNYGEAQRSFSDFLKNYGSHAQVPEAQFYLAECYFQRNQFPEAALAYNEVITRYPKSDHAAESYLKQGICFSKSGQKAAAKARMQELIKKYPSTPAATRAKNFLKTNV